MNSFSISAHRWHKVKQCRKNLLDTECLESQCRENSWNSPDLNHTALNHLAGQKHCALSTQPNPHPSIKTPETCTETKSPPIWSSFSIHIRISSCNFTVSCMVFLLPLLSCYSQSTYWSGSEPVSLQDARIWDALLHAFSKLRGQVSSEKASKTWVENSKISSPQYCSLICIAVRVFLKKKTQRLAHLLLSGKIPYTLYTTISSWKKKRLENCSSNLSTYRHVQSTICRESPTHQLRHFVGIAVLKRRPTVLWLYVLQGQTCLSLGFVPNLVLKLLLCVV